jgi:Zn-dependent protease
MANDSINIGKIYGIDIDLHWTFIALIFITFILSPFISLLFVLLFVCVLVHELAHSITSLRNGIEVRRIILLPLGGASIINEADIDPNVEFRIAIVGPITSILLGCIFGVLAVLAPLGTIGQIANFLFEINLLLGLFNLLPAFPLDGGRVFRSYLQKKKGFFSATMLTIKVSKYFMGIIVLGTLAFAVFGGYPSSYMEFTVIWNLIIVLFLYGGAKSEEKAAILKRDIGGLVVEDAVTNRFAFIKPATKIAELNARIVKSDKIILTKMESSVCIVNLSAQIPGRAKYVRDIAVPISKTDSNTHMFDALALAEGTGIGVIAVFRKGKFIGVATIRRINDLIALRVLRMRSKKKNGS